MEKVVEQGRVLKESAAGSVKGHFSPFHGATLPVGLLVVLLALFSNKAFHIDDPVYLWVAEQIQQEPLDFYGSAVNWVGAEMPMYEANKNPPLVSYFLAAGLWLFGDREVPLHLLFILPAVGVIFGIYRLGREFDVSPAWASLICLFCPVFLVSGTTLMCDVLMLCFWVWSVYLWMRGIRLNRPVLLVTAALLVFLACISKYYAVGLIPLLLVFTWMETRSLRRSAFLLIPLVLLGGYEFYTYALYGKGLFCDAVFYSSAIRSGTGAGTLERILISLAFIGGCLLPVVCLGTVLWSGRIQVLGLVLLAGLIVVLASLPSVGPTAFRAAGEVRWGLAALMGLLVLGGISVLGLAGAECRHFRDSRAVLLLLWIGGCLLFSGAANWTVNARSLLPMAPAAALLAARRLQARYRDLDTNRRLRLWLLPAAAVSLLVAWGDAQLANSARTAAQVIHERYESEAGPIWFEGHWGFQYYMQRYGHRPLDLAVPQVEAGDLIIIPENNSNVKKLSPDQVALVEVLEFPLPLRITTMHPQVGAGFYACGKGPMPFGIGEVPPERYFVFRVKQGGGGG